MSEIKKFYANKNVLITGATGFIGKVLVEKLVRECDDINCVYLIVRQGRKSSFEQRCKEYLNHLVFDYVRAIKPHQLEKIKIINGDLTQDDLALNNYELKEIYTCVNIILHCGAAVRFDLTIRDALNSNTIGVYRLMEIAKRIEQLEIFVLVSTTYCQENVAVTEERHYKSHIDLEVLVKACNRFNENTINALQAKILGDFPNTYSFSKHLSEDLVYQYRNEFPICVVRPSVVTAAKRDPLPGYCEGLNGFFGFGVGAARGVIRTFFLEKKGYVFCVPVDIVANGVITASWLHGTKRKDQIEYYNASIFHENSATFEDYCGLIKSYRFMIPCNYAIWSPNGSFTCCIYYHYVRVFLFQIIPAIVLDALLRLFGRQPIMMQIQRKIFAISNFLVPYCRSGIRFNVDRFAALHHYQNNVDKEIFDTNLHKVNSVSIVLEGARGMRKFICKEKEEDYPRAIITMKFLFLLDVVVKSILLYYLVKYIWKIFLGDL